MLCHRAVSSVRLERSPHTREVTGSSPVPPTPRPGPWRRMSARPYSPGLAQLLSTLRSLLGGFLMGTADLVPGVSGGTMALVLGFYERLVASIRAGSSLIGGLLKADGKAVRRHWAAIEWCLLLHLLGGILVAVATLSRFLSQQLDERPTILAGVFFGLVLGSVPIAWRRLHHSRPGHAFITLITAAVLFTLLGLGEGRVAAQPMAPAFLGAGALAICAMILPGISGSLILVLIGMYGPVLGAVADRRLGSVAVFLLGAVAGLALFSQLLHWALRTYHDLVLAALVGLMAGSLRVLWPWPDGVASPGLAVPGPDWPQVLIAVVFGVITVHLLARVAALRQEEVNRSL